MSALPPKADIAESDWHVRFVPITDIEGRVKECPLYPRKRTCGDQALLPSLACQ